MFASFNISVVGRPQDLPIHNPKRFESVLTSISSLLLDEVLHRHLRVIFLNLCGDTFSYLGCLLDALPRRVVDLSDRSLVGLHRVFMLLLRRYAFSECSYSDIAQSTLHILVSSCLLGVAVGIVLGLRRLLVTLAERLLSRRREIRQLFSHRALKFWHRLITTATKSTVMLALLETAFTVVVVWRHVAVAGNLIGFVAELPRRRVLFHFYVLVIGFIILIIEGFLKDVRLLVLGLVVLHMRLAHVSHFEAGVAFDQSNVR